MAKSELTHIIRAGLSRAREPSYRLTPVSSTEGLMYTAQIRIFVYNLLSTTEHLKSAVKEKTGGIFIAYRRFCCFHG